MALKKPQKCSKKKHATTYVVDRANQNQKSSQIIKLDQVRNRRAMIPAPSRQINGCHIDER
jgi:hypothetical protein